MKSYLSAAVYATALLLSSVSADAILSTASAQVSVSIDFNTFHRQLSRYGDWVYSDRWGEVWIPGDVSADFHPYATRGHWADTDEYGWIWVSDYEWGDIPFHYGRWVNDPDDGWMWLPGYVWSPGWVVWRNNGQYTGWMPMPPDDEFLGRGPSTSISVSIGGLSLSFNSMSDDYGYSRWYGRDYGENRFASNWVFIDTRYIGARDYRSHWAPRNNYPTIIRNSRNITNYTVVNNYIVNRSIDRQAVQRAGARVQTVRASEVIRQPQFISRADTGSQIQARIRAERPRGTGLTDSAPKPTPQQVESLSTKAPRTRGGNRSPHLFTRDTVEKAPLPTGPGVQPATGATEPGNKNGPGSTATPPGQPGKVKTNPPMVTPPDRSTPDTTPRRERDKAPDMTTPNPQVAPKPDTTMTPPKPETQPRVRKPERGDATTPDSGSGMVPSTPMATPAERPHGPAKTDRTRGTKEMSTPRDAAPAQMQERPVVKPPTTQEAAPVKPDKAKKPRPKKPDGSDSNEDQDNPR